MSGRTGAIHPISQLTVKIDSFRRGKQIGYGTGFLIANTSLNCLGLLTCWHVVTGRIPSSPENLLPHYPDSPDLVRFSFVRRDFSQTMVIERGLYDSNGKAMWLEHSIHGRNVDAVLIPFPPQITPPNIAFSASEIPDKPAARVLVGSDVVVLGFPANVPTTSIFPIWKRGIIASEPNLRDESLNFYIDATTRPGMSGGPVYAVINSPFITDDGATVMAAGGPWYRLLGMYSAHFAGEEQLPEIGIVWRNELLPDFSCQRGSNPFTPLPPYTS
jgi:hypothetical protein